MPNVCFQSNDKFMHGTFLNDYRTIQLISSWAALVRFLIIYTSINIIWKWMNLNWLHRFNSVFAFSLVALEIQTNKDISFLWTITIFDADAIVRGKWVTLYLILAAARWKVSNRGNVLFCVSHQPMYRMESYVSFPKYDFSRRYLPWYKSPVCSDWVTIRFISLMPTPVVVIILFRQHWHMTPSDFHWLDKVSYMKIILSKDLWLNNNISTSQYFQCISVFIA